MGKRIFILEVGRPAMEYAAQFGTVDDVLSVHHVSVLEIPEIAAKAFAKIMALASGGNEVHLVLSCPQALAFELGQALGLSNAKIVVYQFLHGRYVKVPPLTREHLFAVRGGGRHE